MAYRASDDLRQSSSFRSAEAVTPSDTVNFTNITRGLYVGVAGDLSLEMEEDGTTIIFTAVPVGTVLHVRCTRVNATNTTATNITALY